MNKLTSIAKAALCASSLAFLHGCITANLPPFEPSRLREIQKEQAEQAPPPEYKPLPTTREAIVVGNELGPRPPRYVPAKRQPEYEIEMSLEEIVHRAVANSLDVRVAGYQAAITEAQILEAEAKFDPTLFSNVQVQNQFQQLGFGGALNPAHVLTQQYQAGIRQNLPSGGQIETRLQSTSSDVTTVPPGTLGGTPDINPFYTTDAVLQLTQPLLRNFGTEVNRAAITVARLDQKTAALDWRDKLEDTLTKIEEAYWRLVEARRIVQVNEELLGQTESMFDTLRARFKQDVRRLELTQAFATLESRRGDLVRALAEIERQSDVIKRLMNDPDLPVASPRVIVPTNRPLEQPVNFALPDQVEVALQNRVDLMQQKLRIERAAVVVSAAYNNLLPQLNLQATADMQGVGHSYNFAIGRQLDDSLWNWSVGFAFEVPIGNRAARAIYQRTLLTRQQQVDQYRAFVDQAGLEVKQGLRDVKTSWDDMIARRHARFAAEDALDAISAYEREGPANIYNFDFVQFKINAQDTLANAQRQEADAVANYNIALSALERAKGTLLHYNNVILKEEPGPEFYKAKYQTKPVKLR